MTQRGYDSLSDTLHHLKTVRREQISEYMGIAIADGDLSESAAYDEARMQQSENETRIVELESQLERAQIIEGDASKGAGLGAKIRVRDEQGQETEYELVGTYEVDVPKGRVSDASPFGQALAGKRGGDTVTVQLPKGKTKKFEVLSVDY